MEGGLTTQVISDSPGRVGQKQINFEQTPGRFPEGTLGRIDLVLKSDEKRADFLRTAVEAELRKRERSAKAKPE